MLGVPRNGVVLQPHDPAWIDEYNCAKDRFLETFHDDIVAIEHVGSTAINGIAAKPMLDIAIVFKSMTEQIFQAMKEKGYTYYKEVAAGKHLFVLRGENDISLQHIHCYELSNITLFNEQIQFRNFLQTHAEYAKEYEMLKLKLSEMYYDDRKKYTAGKQDFFDKIKDIIFHESVT